MKRLASQTVRYASRDVARVVGAVARLPLELPEGPLYWCAARGPDLLVAGEHGIPAWGGMPGEPVEDGADLCFTLPAGSPFPRLRLRRRPMAPNLFVHAELDDFEALGALADLRAPARWWFRPRGIEVEIGHRCNLRCTGCAIIDEVEAAYDGPLTDTLLGLLTECDRLGLYGYTLTGGEPFMKPEVLEALIARSPLDLLKIQTNAKVFSNQARTEAMLARLGAAGIAERNRFVRPSLNVSLGMQTEAGTPLENVAHLTVASQRAFGDRVNVVLNVLVWQQHEVDTILRELDAAHRRLYGRRYPLELVMRIAQFQYNATPRLESSGLLQVQRSTVRERIEALPEGFLCMAFDRDPSTPLPRILVRADGTLYPCSCFGFVGSPGNVYQRPLEALLDEVNADALFREVSETGLPGLFAKAVAARPELAERAVPTTVSICKVCKALRQPDRPLFEPS